MKKILLLLLSLTLTGAVLAQETVKGLIKDETGQALPGATVVLKGTSSYAVSDVEGQFAIAAAKEFPFTLQVNFVGYQSQEIEIYELTGELAEITLKNENVLNEVVVVGYGEQKRSDFTGSLGSLPDELKTQPVSSPDKLLQGAVAGVQVTQSSGQPGAGTSIRIRGGTSITGGNEPLYVIDGFPVYNGDAATDAGVTAGPRINPLSSLNPGDIESIDVLKDASATAIYGSRGANGVILITTKNAKKNSTTITYDGYYGTQEVIRLLPMLNAEEWGYLKNDALADSGKPALYTQEQLDQLGKGTNWQEEVFTEAPIQNHNLSIATGGEKTRILLSVNYFDQEGIIIKTGFDRYSGRLNIDHEFNSKIRIGATLNGSVTHADVAPESVVQNTLAIVPVVPVRDENGDFTANSSYGATVANPVNTLYSQTNETNTTRYLLNGYGQFEILEGLTFRVSLGTDIINNKQNRYLPSTVYEAAVGGQASVGSLSSLNWLNENTLNYKKVFAAKHSLDVLLGNTSQKFSSEVFTAAASNFVTDEFTYNNLGSGAVLGIPTSASSESTLKSFLGRINYTFDDRYFLTLTVRADGSSRFGEDNKWGTFPSAAIGWNISNEKFFNVKPINSLKIRLSAGQTGNQEIQPYQSIARLVYYPYTFGNTIAGGFAPGSYANADLGWETTKQYDIGLDVSLFSNRVTLSSDLYYKRTEDLLLEVPIPYTSGLENAFQNAGEVENKGIELSLKTLNTVGKFEWTTNFIFSSNKNKVLGLGDGVDFFIPINPATVTTPSGIVKVGHSLGSFYMYVADGLFQEGDDFSVSPTQNTKAGSQKYKDLNKDGAITQADDRTIVGHAEPKFLASMTNTFRYKNFDLTVFLQSSYGNDIFNRTRADLEVGTGFNGAYGTLRNRWTPTNTDTDMHRAIEDPSATLSSRFIEDGSYIRLKNISLGYSLPGKIASKLKLKGARFYISGQNMVTWTNYTGFDPEVNRNGQNPLNSGVDVGVYPGAKTFLGGLTLTF